MHLSSGTSHSLVCHLGVYCFFKKIIENIFQQSIFILLKHIYFLTWFPSPNSFGLLHNSPPTHMPFLFPSLQKNNQASKHTGRIKIKEIKHKLTSSYKKKCFFFSPMESHCLLFLTKRKNQLKFINRCLG